MDARALPRYSSLDMWRGIACLAVVVYHAGYYAAHSGYQVGAAAAALRLTEWLQHGVSIFFVISGYCITAAAASTHRGDGRLVTYFARRFRRIFPPYWVMLWMTAALFSLAATFEYASYLIEEWPGTSRTNVIPPPWAMNPWQWLGTLTLTEGWRTHIVWRDGPQWLLGTAWTLGYEEQFYAVAGALLALSRTRGFVMFYRGAAAVSIAVIALPYLMPYGYRVGFFFDGMWLLFALGIAVYRHIQHRDSVVAWLLAASLGYCLLYPNERLIVAIVFSALLVVGHRCDRLVSRSAALAPLRACGAMCYSLYLVHWPIAKALARPLFDAGFDTPAETLFVTIPAITALSLAAGWGFHLTVERRFLNTGPATVLVPAEAALASPAVS